MNFRKKSLKIQTALKKSELIVFLPWIFNYFFSDETAKWEKITYLGIATCSVLAIYTLSKGHTHHEEPPVSLNSFCLILFLVDTFITSYSYVYNFHSHFKGTLFFCNWLFDALCCVNVCSHTHICTFATRSSHGVCYPNCYGFQFI